MRRVYLILVLFPIFIILLIGFFIAAFQKTPSGLPQAIPTPTPVAPFFPLHEASPTAAIVPTGETTTIDGIITNNILTTQPFDDQGDRALADITDAYRIVYLSGTNQFLLTITGTFDKNRSTAEQALLRLLNVSPTDACRLNVVVQTTLSSNPDEAGQSFPLSFCSSIPENGNQETTTSTPVKQITYKTIQSLDVTVGNPSSGGLNLQEACSGRDCITKLSALGISITGTQGLNGDPYGRTKLLYDILTNVFQSPSAYGTLLGLPRNSITVQFNNGGCTGHASHTGFLILNGFGNCSSDIAAFMVVHELSHMIAFRNPGLYNKFLNTISYNRMRALPTYNCQLDYGPHGPYPAECFADMIGEYVVYKTYRDTVSARPSYFTGRAFSNYPTAFSDFYNFAKTNIFQGLTF